MFYIYILYSKKSHLYYVGYTDDVKRRLQEHNLISENSYTSKHRPWQLEAVFDDGNSRSLAMKIEKHIKKQKSKEYICEIIRRNSISRLLERFSSAG